jgi:isochorismate synthase
MFSPIQDFLSEASQTTEHLACVVAVQAPHVLVERFLALPISGVASLWTPGDMSALRMAGRGVAVELKGQSLLALRDEAKRLLEGVRCVGVKIKPRLWGGQTFDPERFRRDDVWEDFPAASLRIPRWWLQSEGENTVLCVALPQKECAQFVNLGAQIEDTLEALTRDVAPVRASTIRTHRDAGRLEWDGLVENALERFADGSAEKLVAARRAEVTTSGYFDLYSVLSSLDVPTNAVRFALGHGDSTWIGVSPERLVSLNGNEVRLDALAGSIPRGDGDPQIQMDALLASDKDLREHAHVVDGLRSMLAPFCVHIDAPTSPGIRTLRYVHHLWTPVHATLRTTVHTHILELVAALHPTPALGGTPREIALSWIASHEHHTRGWYASPMGWCDIDGNGEFFVAIRSALLRRSQAWMYAGAGLVKGSVAETEWRETDAKMAPMRAALGVTE